MKTIAISAASAALLLAGAVAAQAATTQATPAPAAAPQTGVDAGPVEQNSQAMRAADQPALKTTSIRQQIEAQLTKDGYSAIKVTPSSFLIRAMDKKGNPVEMVIGPDSFIEVTEVAPAMAAATGNQSAPAPAAAPKAATP